VGVDCCIRSLGFSKGCSRQPSLIISRCGRSCALVMHDCGELGWVM
jgi:hypothetical protein